MDPDLFKEVEDLIQTTNIPNITYQGTPKGRRITFGYVPPMMRYTHEPKPSAQNKNHPALYRALLKLGNAICPFAYDAITVNKNGIPFDTKGPQITSGIRIGTPAVTTRGMKEKEMRLIASYIADVISNINDENKIQAVAKQVKTLCAQFPLYQQRIK